MFAKLALVPTAKIADSGWLSSVPLVKCWTVSDMTKSGDGVTAYRCGSGSAEQSLQNSRLVHGLDPTIDEPTPFRIRF